MQETSRSDLRAYLLLVVVMLLWAGNSIVGRAVRMDIPPGTLAFGRWLIAVLVLLPFAWPQLRRDRAAARAGAFWLLLLGLFGVAAFNGFLYHGLQYTGAANALLLQAAIPALVLAMDRLLNGTRVPALRLLGVAVSTLGVLAIVAHGDIARLIALHLGTGDLMVFAAVLSWAIYTALLPRRPKIAAPAFLLLTFTVGLVAMAPLAVGEAAAGQHVHWSWAILAAFLYVGLLPSVVAYFIYDAAVTRIGAARTGQTITLMPLFGAILSAVLLGERLEGYHYAGMGLILAGIILSALSSRAKPQISGGATLEARLEDRA